MIAEKKEKNRVAQKNSGGRKKARAWLLSAIFDLCLTGAVLCVFALFHHVLPQMRLGAEGVPAPVATVAAGGGAEYNKENGDAALTWREKFAEHFSASVISGESSYSSPDVSVTVTKHSSTEAYPALTYYVADIYIAQIENFRTSFADGQTADAPETIAEQNAAVVAINGDYCTNQTEGFLVRNGQVYLTEQTTADICVLYYDGRMETYAPDEYLVDEVLGDRPYQVWKFGPELLESDGSAKSVFNTSDVLTGLHPRSGIGYFEPGHYCFVIADGRQSGYSDGVDMRGFAEIFASLGCVSAYNLDGGASAVMVYGGRTVNAPSSGGRYVSDMLLIRETDGAEAEK